MARSAKLGTQAACGDTELHSRLKQDCLHARVLCLELHGDTAMGQPAWEPLKLLVTPRLLADSALGGEWCSCPSPQRGEGRRTGILCLPVAGDSCGMSVPPLHAPGWHREHSQRLRLGLGSSHGWSPSWCLQAGCGREPASWGKSRLFPGAGRRNTPPCAFGRQQLRGRCEVMGSHPLGPSPVSGHPCRYGGSRVTRLLCGITEGAGGRFSILPNALVARQH